MRMCQYSPAAGLMNSFNGLRNVAPLRRNISAVAFSNVMIERFLRMADNAFFDQGIGYVFVSCHQPDIPQQTT